MSNWEMVEERYYTPEIEEFHVGFEYELLSNVHGNYWRFEVKKEVFTENLNCGAFSNIYLLNDLNIFSNVHLLDDLSIGKIRVKYLDKEDIESLGWKIDQRGDYSIDSFYISWHTGSERPMWVEITREEEGIKFKGYIKNKSELKKLMKQLGIL